jgi:VanZ family protein
MGVLFWLSSFPGDNVKLPDFWMSDKVMHFMAYGFLGCLISLRMLIRRVLPAASPLSVIRSLGELVNWPDGLGQSVGILFAASDEIHQMFVPLREASTLDWTADVLGIVVGSWLCRFLYKKLNQKYSVPSGIQS